MKNKCDEAKRDGRVDCRLSAIMRQLAVADSDNVDHWGRAGLLHDIDIGETANDLSRHGAVDAQNLRELAPGRRGRFTFAA